MTVSVKFRRNSGNTTILANFSFDHARVSFFVHNDFPCGTNNLRNPICPPLAVFPAETVVKPPFSNFFSDYARVLVFGPNDFSCGVNNLRNPICPPLAVFLAETAVKPPFF